MTEIQNRFFYNTGEIIVEEGQPGSHICIIEKGLVEIWKKGSDGKKVILGTLSAGQIFGEMSIVDHAPRAATVSAIEPTTIINIDGDKLIDALKLSPPIISTLLKALIKNLKNAQAK